MAAAARRNQKPNQHKEWYEKNLEEQRTRGREAARQRRRLTKAGLPLPRIHRVFAEERRTHDAEAKAYFARRRSIAERAVIAAESIDEQVLDVPGQVAQERRAVIRAQFTPRKTAPGASSVNHRGEDLPDEVIQWRRARDLQALKQAHETLAKKIRAERPQIYEQHRQRNEARAREEVRLDSIARGLRGLPPYENEQETQNRLNDDVTATINQLLRAASRRTITRARDIVRRQQPDRDPAAPHQVPGAGAGTQWGLQ